LKNRKRILVAPLDWGLGHATRCVPIISEIISQGHDVIIAADGRAAELLKAEFPEIRHIRLKGYKPVYPKDSGMVAAMFFQLPKFLIAIVKEHFQLRSIIKKHSIDIIISDNRYGLWTRKRKCVMMTHQLFIRMPSGMKWFEPLLNRLNHFFIKKFDWCWVPDVAGDENLSGELSHGANSPVNLEYIGWLPRLSFPNSLPGKYEILVLLSGPEPQRTILEHQLFSQLKSLHLKTLIVQGISERKEKTTSNDFIETVSHLTTKALSEAISQAEFVVCRAGYSTIMELASLQKKALLIPTPGQTEQEYLAQRCQRKGYFIAQNQNRINLQQALTDLKNMKSAPITHNGNAFKEAVRELLSSS